MAELNHLSTEPPRLASMDFSLLLSQGIAHSQRLGGRQWTDYNEHDPGVTILEQLCYALTDIGYRIDFPMPDILAEQAQLSDPGNNPLYTGDQILTCNPLTLVDFRKLLIDAALKKYGNFKNIWLQPLEHSAAGPAGVYQMQLEVYDLGQDNAELIDVLKNTFLTNRNLNEDMDPTVQLLQILPITPQATVEVDAGADPNTVMADILFQVQDALVPFVRVESIAQLLKEGVSPDRIYVGPLLQSGAIADACLLPKKTSVSVSDVGNAILRSAGVRSVTQLDVLAGGKQLPADGSVQVAAQQVPRLTPSLFAPQPNAGSGLTLTRQGVTLTVDPQQVGKLLATMLADVAGAENYAPDNALARDYTTLPQGQKRDIARYFSIQRHFPQTYGIGEYGVKLGQPQTESDVKNAATRQAQARQLKAYLLFFEQMLSDCQQQLASGARLLSLETDLDRSYFWQSLVAPGDGPPNMVELLRPGSPPVPPIPPVPPVDGNRYTVYVLDRDAQATPLLRSREFASQAEADAAQAHILASGAEFGKYSVRDLPGAQFQILLDEGNTAFGCQRFSARGEAEAGALHAAMLIDELTHDPRLRERCVQIEVSGKYILRLLDDEGAIIFNARRLTASGWEARRRRMLGCGLSAANYQKEETGRGHWRLRLMDEQQRQLLADGEQRFASEEAADHAILATVALFQRMCGQPSLQADHFVAQPPLPPAPGPTPTPTPDTDPRVLAYMAGLDSLVRDFDPYPARRNRFLDHLLARFNEQFDDRTLRQLDPRPASCKHLFERDLIYWKNTFLRNYVQKPPPHAVGTRSQWLGGGKSRGFNQAVDFRDSGNLTGLALRMRLLLGMPTQAPPVVDFPTAVGGDAAALRLTLAQPDAAYVFSSTDPDIFQRLLRYGTDAACYSVVPADDADEADEEGKEGPCKVTFQWPGTDSAQEILSAASAADAWRAIARLTAYLQAAPQRPDLIYGGEKMHVLEHILLRTESGEPASDSASDFPSDKQQPDPEFYAFRVSVFFPSEPIRFKNPAFRAFAQQIAEQNCPAHIDVRCYWLKTESMSVFLDLYNAWANLYGDGPTTAVKQAAAGALAGFIRTVDAEPPAPAVEAQP